MPRANVQNQNTIFLNFISNVKYVLGINSNVKYVLGPLNENTEEK